MKVLNKNEFKEKIDLDLKDKKILKLLSINSRFPLTKICKYIRLTRDAVNYRIKGLEEKNIITGYRTLINLKKLGYSSYHIFIELHPNREKEKELIDFFKKNENINAIIKYSGKLDYEIALVCKTFEEFDNVFNKIINKYEVKNYEILIILNTIKSSSFPESLLNEKIPIENKKNDGSFFKNFINAKNTDFKLDKADIKILNLISNDAKISLTELSKNTSLSLDVISYRIKKMIESKIILEFRPVINYNNLGFSVYTLLLSLQNLNDKKEIELIEFFKNNKNILWGVKTIGKWNLLIYILTKDEQEFHSTISEIKNKFSSIIKTYETLLADEEYKYTYFPEVLSKI